MIAHVITRRIAEKDYIWLVKDYYDNTVDTGKSKGAIQARRDGRLARDDYIKRVKAQQNAGLPKLKTA